MSYDDAVARALAYDDAVGLSDGTDRPATEATEVLAGLDDDGLEDLLDRYPVGSAERDDVLDELDARVARHRRGRR